MGFYLHRRSALVNLWESSREAYEDWPWKHGSDRRDLAKTRLALNNKDPGKDQAILA